MLLRTNVCNEPTQRVHRTFIAFSNNRTSDNREILANQCFIRVRSQLLNFDTVLSLYFLTLLRGKYASLRISFAIVRIIIGFLMRTVAFSGLEIGTKARKREGETYVGIFSRLESFRGSHSAHFSLHYGAYSCQGNVRKPRFSELGT